MSREVVQEAFARASRVFPEVEPAVPPVRRGDCFVTCWHLAARHSEFTYAEGTACAPDGVRYPHAWLVRAGRVYDPTWGNQGTAYEGALIASAYVRRLAGQGWEPADGGVRVMLWRFPQDLPAALA